MFLLTLYVAFLMKERLCGGYLNWTKDTPHVTFLCETEA